MSTEPTSARMIAMRAAIHHRIDGVVATLPARSVVDDFSLLDDDALLDLAAGVQFELEARARQAAA